MTEDAVYRPTENTNRITEEMLAGFTGTTRYIRHSLNRNVVMTEGAHFLSRNGAAWLIDRIALSGIDWKKEAFQSWTLKITKRHESGTWGKGKLTCTDGRYEKLGEWEVDATDFPLDEVKLFAAPTYCDDRTVLCVMLASEY